MLDDDHFSEDVIRTDKQGNSKCVSSRDDRAS